MVAYTSIKLEPV